MDFGLAKQVVVGDMAGPEETLPALTSSGAVLGTVPYMSPEQVRGEEVQRNATGS